jgi:hypothetical protein
MQKKAEGGNVEKYIQEGLVVLLPRYQEGVGETVVHTTKGKYPDPRSVTWLVERLAAYYNMNLSGLRRHCGQLLGLRHHISLPLSQKLVLLPLKLRQAIGGGETTVGFVNMTQVKEILPAPVESVAGPSALERPGERPSAEGDLGNGCLQAAEKKTYLAFQGQV